MKTLEKHNIDKPDEVRAVQGARHMDVVTIGDFTMGRGVFEPGWKWSDDVKPIAGTDSCQARHRGVCVSGSMTVRSDDGTEVTYDRGRRLRHGARPRRVGERHHAVRHVRHRRRGVREAR